MEKRSQIDSFRVVHLSSAVEWRGGEQQMLYLWQGLEVKRVNQWIWVPSGQVERKLLREKVILKKLFFRQPWFLIDALRLWYFCKKNKIDLIHAHDSKAHSLAYLSGSLLGLKTPVIVHRRVDNHIKRTFITKKKYLYTQLKKIICVSSNIKRVVDANLPETREKSVVIYSGVPKPEPTHRNKRTMRDQLSIGKNEVLVGNISALDYHKDPHTFFDLAKKMIGEGFEGKFLWIGGGEPLKIELTERVLESGLEKQILFTGYLENAKTYLHELDVFLFTSSSEGLGTTVLDAMISKVPVVATAGGGVPELISHENTGILVPVGDLDGLSEGIKSILSGHKEREKIIEAAYIKASTGFSVEKMVEETHDLYRRTLKVAD